ncbi:hypothetical protein BJ166DRAFT_544825 [Pestalotiopsis sp. NC0098]|nr:hypothetical protein BJ166DRAFT_544825 [Pestalotiopsis sp. NC0098]
MATRLCSSTLIYKSCWLGFSIFVPVYGKAVGAPEMYKHWVYRVYHVVAGSPGRRATWINHPLGNKLQTNSLRRHGLRMLGRMRKLFVFQPAY